MKIAKTPLESIRILWTIYGIMIAIAVHAIDLGNRWFRGNTVDWLDLFPNVAAIFAVVFAVHGAVCAAAKAPKE